MFDLGWTELLVIGIVALIVIGPKDLPVMFRKVGQFVGKARGMAREFSRAMDDAADQAGVKEVSKTLKAASNPLKTSMDQVKQATSEFASYDPGTETGKLAAERKEAAKKIHEAAKQRAAEKREAEQKDVSQKETTTSASKPAVKAPVAKKAPAKTLANKKTTPPKAAATRKSASPKSTSTGNSADDAAS